MQDDIKLCVFDVDGTLINTKELILSAFEYTLSKHGLPKLSREELTQKIGKPLGVDYTNITGVADTTELCATHRAYQNENQHLVSLFPNVLETLRSLKERDVKISAATNRSRITMLGSLQQVGLDDIFDLLITVEDVVNNKPAPDCILKAMEHFSVSPQNTFMVGDQAVDIQAGKAAGVKTILVDYEHKTSTLEHPDFMVHGLGEILEFI